MISGEGTIDSVCLVQAYKVQQQNPDQEAGKSHSSQAAVEKLTSHPVIAPEAAPKAAREEEPKAAAAAVAHAAAEAEVQVNASQGAALLAVAERAALLAVAERVRAGTASEVHVDTSQQSSSSERRGTTGTIALIGSAVAVLACGMLVCLMLCCTGGKQEKAVAKRNTSAGPIDNKVGKKKSMRSRLSQRSLPSQAASEARSSACGSTTGPLPGEGPWWRSRLSKRATNLENSQGPTMTSHRSSVSVVRQGDPSQWAPDGSTMSQSSTTPTFGLQHGRPAGPSERRFVVPMDSLAEVGRKGVFQVRSEKGDLDMRVAIDKDTTKGPRLTVSAAGGGAARPMTTVGLSSELPDAGTGDAARLEVKDSEGGSFGLLEQTSEGSYVLALNGAPLLVVDGADDASLHMSVRTGNGQQVATVCCSFAMTGRENQEEIVELLVGPGADPTLVVTSVLSVLLLCVEDYED